MPNATNPPKGPRSPDRRGWGWHISVKYYEPAAEQRRGPRSPDRKGARMPCNTEWVRGGYPTTLDGWGANALHYWIGGGMMPYETGWVGE